MTYASLIQPVLWAAAGGASLLFLARAFLAHKRHTSTKRLLKAAAVSLLAAFVLVPAIGVVPAGYRGVVYQWDGGVSPDERNEGVTLLIPWFQHLINSSVRTQKVYSPKVFSQSSDLQEITVVSSVNYHVDPVKAAELYQEVGPQYPSTVIQPAFFKASKAAVGRVIAEDFALNRDPLARMIEKRLKKQLSGYGIVVEYVNIEDAIFDPEFVAAVKAKVIAEQYAAQQTRLIEAEAAIKEQVIIQAQARARSVFIEATAQAKANEKIAASVTPVLLRWQWLVTWDGVLPTTLVGDKDTTLLLNGGGLGESYPTYQP